MDRPKRSILRYGAAVLSVAVALGIRGLIAPLLGNRAPYATFLIAILFSAWFGGNGPGLLALVLGGLTAIRFVLGPVGEFRIQDTQDEWSIIAYVVVGSTLIWFNHGLQKQKRRAEENAALAESRRSEADRQRETLNVTLSSIGEGVVVTNAKGIVTRLNAVAERLTGWSSADGVGQPLATVFPIFDEETRKPVVNPAVRAMEEGRTVGLANHTVLISRSGNETAIDDSAAPIRDAHGKILGAILIFRDVTQRRKVEKALVESERTFRIMADTAPVMIWRSDTEGARSFFNKRWLDFTGRTLEVESGDGWRDGIHPDDAERSRIRYWEAFERREAFEMEYRLRRFDGEYRWVFDTGVPEFSSSEAFEGHIGSCLDITDRKKYEQEILKISWIVENTEDAILSKSLDGTILTWNKGAERVYGYTAGQAIGQSVLILVPEDRRPENEAVLSRVRRGESVTYETERVRSDGQRIRLAVTLSPVRNTTGEIVGMSAIARDISARVRAEEAVRESEQRLRFALKAARMGTWTLEPKQGLARWSPELEDLFGLAPGTFGGTQQDSLQLIHPDDRQQVTDAINEAIANGREYELEFRYRRADGSFGWMSSRGRPFYEAAGSLLRLAGVAMDVTDRKRLELELTRRTEELVRSNRDLEQFAFISSHDLQEPLRTVGAYAQLLERRYRNRLDSDADQFIDFIVGGVRRMQDQIHALLEYSRVGTPGRGIHPVEAEGALRSALSNLQSAVRETGAVITHDPLPAVQSNALELAQVFQNLISNAIKFRSDAVPRIHISAQQKDGAWQFSVRDNGIGIEPQYGRQIFEIFKRLHGSEHDGTGIGLAICQKAIETHGGRIWVESEAGAGSTFKFTLRPADSTSITWRT